jgi:hypothetical protein
MELSLEWFKGPNTLTYMLIVGFCDAEPRSYKQWLSTNVGVAVVHFDVLSG